MSRRLALAAALVALALAAPARAPAQALGGATIDFVRTDAHGRHEAIVSVIDPIGRPVGELEHAFAARLDGRDVSGLAVQSMRARFPQVRLTLVVDAALLGHASLPAVQEALATLGHEMGPGDRLRVVAAGRAVRAHDGAADGAVELARGLGSLAEDAAPREFDALYAAAHDQSRRGDRESGAILVITRGTDGGSTHTALEALALARTESRLTPVTVVFVGDEGTADVTDRLTRLAEHSAGTTAHVTSADDLAGALPPLFQRAVRRWVLDFAAPGWDAKVPRHRLEVGVEQGGEARAATYDYATADVLAQPWWRSAWAWLLPALALLALGVAWFATRPRQQLLLVHDGDAQDGMWYEVFRLPVRVGAADGNDIVFADRHVSRHHAVFERRGRTVELTDLNSENGTFVNDERVARRVLADGDRIDIGPDVHLVYEAR